MTKVIDRALADLHAMQNAGVDAVIVENFCDHPAGTKLEPEQMAALTAVATVVRARRPSRSALMRRSVIRWRVWPSPWPSGATFIRVPVFVDTVVTSDGIVKPLQPESCALPQAARRGEHRSPVRYPDEAHVHAQQRHLH